MEGNGCCVLVQMFFFEEMLQIAAYEHYECDFSGSCIVFCSFSVLYKIHFLMVCFSVGTISGTGYLNTGIWPVCLSSRNEHTIWFVFEELF